MPAPDLPVLSAQQPIASTSRPTSNFLLFMEKTRKAIIAAFTAQDAIDARQDETDALLAQAIEDIATAIGLATAATAAVGDLADGTTPFTAVNVGGTIVAENAGLADDVVVPQTLTSGAANQMLSATTGGSIALTAGVSAVVQTLVVTTAAGEAVDLTGSVRTPELADPSDRPLVTAWWDRDGVTVSPLATIVGLDVVRAADAQRYVLSGSVLFVPGTDVPGAGTHTYELVANFSVNGSATNRYGRVLTATRP